MNTTTNTRGVSEATLIAVYDAVSRSNLTRDVKTAETKARIVREALADDCSACNGTGQARVVVATTPGSFMSPPEDHYELDVCPDCDGTGLSASALSAEPAERVPEGWVLVPREALGYVSDLLTERKHGTAGRSPAHNARVVVDYWLTASPAPSEGGKGVEAVSHYVPAKTCQCLTIGQRKYCLDRHVCSMPETQCSTGAAR